MQPYSPACEILGVKVSAVNMENTLHFIEENIFQLSGSYMCVCNVHTTVMSYENDEYLYIQNHAAMVLPDGGPLSVIGKKRGYTGMERVTGPDLMGEVFAESAVKGYRHFFYGATEVILEKLEKKLLLKYPGIQIAGLYSPPFRELTPEEDKEVIEKINAANADFVWIGLGAPKQERWMYKHKGRIKGLMIGVGAGFDYYAEELKRAPMWMQRRSLEWLYRLLQEPKRLLGRYIRTNFKFIIMLLRDNH